MHQKYLQLAVAFAALASLLLQAQAAAQVEQGYSARVRVFQQADITLYPGEYCYGSDNPQAIHASDGEPSIFSFNKKVGMPVTDDMPAAYREYIIPAGGPVSVKLQWQAEKDDIKASCGPIASTFYPQPGKDYDITIGYAVNCFVQIRELFEIAPGKASARPAAAGPSFSCARN